MQFDIKDFQKNSIVKFYYDRGRHSSTSLRSYKGNLFVHKFLGNEYRGISKKEYEKEILLMNDLYKLLKDKTEIELPETSYVGYNSDFNCIERVEKYSGNSLRIAFPIVSYEERVRIIKTLLNQINSLIKANDDKVELDFSIDPTPDNFTYDGNKVYFIDFMPPLIKGRKINPQILSDKSRTETDLSVQTFRYFNQKGLYLTFLAKLGTVDITFSRKLFSLTLDTIKNKEVKKYIYNDDIKFIESLTKKHLYYGDLETLISERLKDYKKIERDMLRLMSVYFLDDYTKIATNARKYRVKEILDFLDDKRCTAELISGLIYSDFRDSNMHETFKDIVVNLIALQYGY